DQNGRIKKQSTGTKVKTLARSILEKRRLAVVENRHLDIKKESKVTFHKLCREYWDTRGKTLKMKGLDSMIEIWSGLVINQDHKDLVKDRKTLGNPVVRDMTSAQIERFLNAKHEGEDGISNSARNRHLQMMRSMFNWGISEGLITNNPTI